MMTRSLVARIFSSMMTRSFVRPPRIVITWFPAFFIAWAIGCDGAMPIPPPTITTVPKSSMCVGFPSGPARSQISWPGSSDESCFVVFPTTCTTSSIQPSSAFPSAIVSGMRSPASHVRRMMNCPALRFFAISGASTLMRKTNGVMNSFSRILFISPCGLSFVRS